MRKSNNNKYKQLSSEERDQIAIFRAQGYSQNNIAQMIGRNKSTVSRELKRNSAPIYEVYLPHKAHQRAQDRKHSAGQRERLKNPLIREYATNQIKQGWSPEQIAGRLSLENPALSISHEAIYQYIYDIKIRKESDLTVYLARSNKIRKTRGHSRKHRKSHIPERVSLDKRPKYVQKRIQPGHWEADTAVSRQSKAALAISVERTSRLIQLGKLTQKTSDQFSQTLTKLLEIYPRHMRRTITYDNGSENVDHLIINQKLGTDSYFCNPYHSWEKGSVENTIGLVRRFLPKKTDFATINPDILNYIQYSLNNRPRKCLNFKTPLEVFNKCVALTP